MCGVLESIIIYFANMLGIATRGVRVCVRVFGFLFVFGIDYMEASWVVRQECVGLWCREVISGIATRGVCVRVGLDRGVFGSGVRGVGSEGLFLTRRLSSMLCQSALVRRRWWLREGCSWRCCGCGACGLLCEGACGRQSKPRAVVEE